MKKVAGIATVLFSLFLISCGSSKKTETDYKGYIATAVAEKDFTVNVDRAFPQGSRMINLSSPYSLTIKGDSVYSYLPFFGVAYSVPYGGGSGLNFKGVMTNYEISKGKRGETFVRFNVKTSEDYFKYLVEIWGNGNSSISVQPQNRQSISYDGMMKIK